MAAKAFQDGWPVGLDRRQAVHQNLFQKFVLPQIVVDLRVAGTHDSQKLERLRPHDQNTAGDTKYHHAGHDQQQVAEGMGREHKHIARPGHDVVQAQQPQRHHDVQREPSHLPRDKDDENTINLDKE